MILEKLRLSAEDKVDKLSYANEESFYYVIVGYGLLEVGEYGLLLNHNFQYIYLLKRCILFKILESLNLYY